MTSRDPRGSTFSFRAGRPTAHDDCTDDEDWSCTLQNFPRTGVEVKPEHATAWIENRLPVERADGRGELPGRGGPGQFERFGAGQRTERTSGSGTIDPRGPFCRQGFPNGNGGDRRLGISHSGIISIAWEVGEFP